MTATESAYAEQVAEKMLDTMPTRVSKIRPSHTFTYEMDSDDLLVFAEHPKIIHKIYRRAVSMACERYWSRYKVRQSCILPNNYNEKHRTKHRGSANSL